MEIQGKVDMAVQRAHPRIVSGQAARLRRRRPSFHIYPTNRKSALSKTGQSQAVFRFYFNFTQLNRRSTNTFVGTKATLTMGVPGHNPFGNLVEKACVAKSSRLKNILAALKSGPVLADNANGFGWRKSLPRKRIEHAL
jgi:hypothetical protein